MPILFGWGHKTTQDYGPVKKHACASCGCHSDWGLLTQTLWFTFFFVPVIPYSRKHFFYCPVCGTSIEVDATQFSYYRSIALLNVALNEGKITKKEYKAYYDQVNAYSELEGDAVGI